MNPREIYLGSDGEATKSLYSHLERRGPLGMIALNLFRAQKCSARAKVYRGGIRGQGSYKRMAYERKSWSMDLLCRALIEHGAALNIRFGWKEDPRTVFGQDASWVLYVELPAGQVSFHSPTRGTGPDYTREWDQQHSSEERIIAFACAVAAMPEYQADDAPITAPMVTASAPPEAPLRFGDPNAIAIARRGRRRA